MSEQARAIVELHTDGACSGNPGPGGWAFVLRHGASGKELVRAGAEAATTNNRMELRAVIEGLSALKSASEVDLWSDSQYVLNGLKEWIHDWKKRGWKTAAKKPVKNQDLWMALDELASRHVVRFHWIRGHSEHPDNERCDRLAVEARERLVAGGPPPLQGRAGEGLDRGSERPVGDAEYMNAGPQRSAMEQARQLRKDMTAGERALWDVLSGKQLGGFKFRRQHALGPYVADFYCQAAMLVVEVDGPAHRERRGEDRARDRWMEERGITVMRISAQLALEEPEAVGRKILEFLNKGVGSK